MPEDEAPLPGKLMGQMLEWLYREDRFRRGVLTVAGRRLGPGDLAAPVLAVIDGGDVIAPRASVEGFLKASPADWRLLEHTGDAGFPLQHLAPLVGRDAHARLWPQILAWADDCGAGGER